MIKMLAITGSTIGKLLSSFTLYNLNLLDSLKTGESSAEIINSESSFWDFFKGIDLLKIGSSLIGTVITLLIFIGLYFLIKKILERQSRGKSDYGIIKQMILFLIAFSGVVAFIISLPMNPDLKGQVTSLMGIVISAVFALSSATFIGNILAGVYLRFVNSFKPGDFIEVGQHFGRVSEKSLFHIELQTVDRDLLTLPNLLIATTPVKVKRMSGTFIKAEVSLGYDVPRTKIEECLLKAAENASLKDSYVIIKQLGDFSIVYEVHGMLEDLKRIITAQSKLNACVLDALHGDKIEIVSPNFMNQRQVGDTVFIPKQVILVNEEGNENPEASIFDKAEKAENIENKKARIEEIEAKIKASNEQLKDASTDEDKKVVKERIERYKNIKERIISGIEIQQDEMKEE